VLFEYDPKKSQANQAKHGISFKEAQALWDDPRGIEIRLSYPDEPRYARIAKRSEDDREVWTAIFTFRGENARLISVRRARDKEKATYGKSQNRPGI
jgi:uncharacterized DUF497 family protein